MQAAHPFQKHRGAKIDGELLIMRSAEEGILAAGQRTRGERTEERLPIISFGEGALRGDHGNWSSHMYSTVHYVAALLPLQRPLLLPLAPATGDEQTAPGDPVPIPSRSPSHSVLIYGAGHPPNRAEA